MDDGFYLPMSHRANDPLETSGVDMATVDTAVPDSNKGYQMLRAMGWTEGVGLGRKEDGAHCWAPLGIDLGDGGVAGICKLLRRSVVPLAASAVLHMPAKRVLCRYLETHIN